MKLFELNSPCKVRLIGDIGVPVAAMGLKGGDIIYFKHIDGMYSYCKNENGDTVHPAAWTEVEIVDQSSPEKIKQRRSQMLIHSYLYYHLDTSVVSDDQWQQWANELQYLQDLFPDPIGFYDKEFIDWDGSTGMHLPKDNWIRDKAQQLLTSMGK